VEIVKKYLNYLFQNSFMEENGFIRGIAIFAKGLMWTSVTLFIFTVIMIIASALHSSVAQVFYLLIMFYLYIAIVLLLLIDSVTIVILLLTFFKTKDQMCRKAMDQSFLGFALLMILIGLLFYLISRLI